MFGIALMGLTTVFVGSGMTIGEKLDAALKYNDHGVKEALHAQNLASLGKKETAKYHGRKAKGLLEQAEGIANDVSLVLTELIDDGREDLQMFLRFVGDKVVPTIKRNVKLAISFLKELVEGVGVGLVVSAAFCTFSTMSGCPECCAVEMLALPQNITAVSRNTSQKAEAPGSSLHSSGFRSNGSVSFQFTPMVVVASAGVALGVLLMVASRRHCKQPNDGAVLTKSLL